MSDYSVNVAYLLEEFPKLSESFIIEEIKALNDKGVIAGVLSISRPRDLSDRHPDLISLIRYPKGSQALKANCTQIFSLWYWKWLMRTLRFYPTKVLAFFRAVSFLPILREWRPAHLHVHFATFASFMTMCLSERIGIPYSLTIHATGIFQEKKMITKKCEYAKFVVAISKFNRGYLKEHFDVPEEKVNIVHCGIVPDRFDEVFAQREEVKANRNDRARAEEGGTEDDQKEWRIFSIGRLVEKKGFTVLLDALGVMMDDGPWIMVLAGDGPLRPELERKIEQLGLGERVRLLGRISGDQLIEELGKADLFVLPCIVSSNGDMDGIPVVLMEALMCGIPTISTTVSGIPELIVNGETGILVGKGEPEKLADAIRSLMADKEKAFDLGKNGMRKVREEFNVARTSEELLWLFEKK